MNNRSALIVGSASGLAIPVLLFLNARVFGHTFDATEVMLWPSSILLIATEGMSTSESIAVVIASVVINIALYAAIFASIAWVLRYLSPGEVD